MSARAIPTITRTSPQTITQRTTGAIYINQFDNPANPRAHEKTTAPEILRQMDGDIDAIVVGVGSGGTLTGIGRFMKRASPKTRDDPRRSGRLDARAAVSTPAR